MKAEDFDRKFDDGEDVSGSLDLEAARRPGHERKRVDIEFPQWMLDRLDREASRLGVTRQAVIKLWLSERLERREAEITAAGH